VQTDIKKVLAYSTVSQLGYMFMACGVAAFSAGIFHLMTHAFFKGLLFLAAGSVIHGIGGEQDMRKMGGLRKVHALDLLDHDHRDICHRRHSPFAGFFSKDEILWSAYSSSGSWVYWLIGVITAGITSFYMFRLWFLTFLRRVSRRCGAEIRKATVHGCSWHNSHGTATERPHESPWVMLVPLVILALLSLVGWMDAGIGGRFELSSLRFSRAEPPRNWRISRRSEARTGTETLHADFRRVRLFWDSSARLDPSITAVRIARAHRRQLGGLYQVSSTSTTSMSFMLVFVKPLIDGSTKFSGTASTRT
jgi:NADH:ubiquinone oxidoreductase subunit 5 (subunit L)/multisubunit Na+/H+ antiporter MnhA subunit